MQKLGLACKYINYLVIAAVLLPIIFIAEVVYVERQYTASARQAQTQELAKLRTAAAAAWLDGQAAYLRGIAGLQSVQAGNQEVLATEFRSLLAAKTGFLSLEYTGIDGETQVNTNELSTSYIGDRAYFIAAAAGQQYIGELPGTDWQQGEDVTVVAVPVTVNGEITGVVCGVIAKKSIETMTARLVPAGNEPVPTNRWLAWLGLVYLLGVIPLLLIVYVLWRSPGTTAAEPETDSPKFNKPPVAVDRALAAAATTAYKAIKMAADSVPAAITNEIPGEIRVTMPDKVLSAPVPETELIGAQPIQDELTGLYTQAGFEKVLAAAAGKADIGIIACSIDGMKVINDFLGKNTGDVIIKAAAESIKSAIGSAQTAARLEGDKFAVLIPNGVASSLEDSKKDIRYYVDLHNLLHPELPLSITVGCAAAEHGQDLHSVLYNAISDMESQKPVSRVEARKFIMWSIKRYRRRT
ncbi:GGDEF domain-containing protein [Sporomusa malonica]|uniref:Diguanylate cyclase (GGDEF) domain-containing protein n=1 Tax=Sporomusa malonica TaxID=112901 RepID=A0A1W2BI57_9FIRM|nr:GGDEF domain-containing protein [Sporomusa malonica]SMC72629.1 diguanylate cyclase (GGDEF) domain-containing protein [Sporomusa malonica]